MSIAQKTIRIIALSQSWQRGKVSLYRRAIRNLNQSGYHVEFASNIYELDRFGTATIQNRVRDLHAGFADADVDMVMCLDGGWSANQLLPYVDWELIRRNPKPFVGFSDCTVLLNAVYAKTGLVTYLGPVVTTIGDIDTGMLSLNSLESALENESLEVKQDSIWKSGDRLFRSKKRWRTLKGGTAEGVLIGGNLGSFYLLQGTPYMPEFCERTILAIEEDDEAGMNTAKEFDRRLESLLQQPGARENIVGLIVGRFQRSSGVSGRAIEEILSNRFDQTIPIVYDVGFGHTSPTATLRIGGRLCIESYTEKGTRIYGVR